MTARPMTEEERDEAMLAAQRIIAIDEGEPGAGEEVEFIDSVAVARALLSSSAAERGMREALSRLADIADFVAQDANVGIMDEAINAARAALSLEGEDKQARG